MHPFERDSVAVVKGDDLGEELGESSVGPHLLPVAAKGSAGRRQVVPTLGVPDFVDRRDSEVLRVAVPQKDRILQFQGLFRWDTFPEKP